MGYIYVLEFPNRKRYVGQTRMKKPEYRSRYGKNYNGVVKTAIEEFGWSNINKYYWEVPDLQLDDIERMLISLYKSDHVEFGYNMRSGGRSGYGGLSGESNPFYGKKHSEETKKHWSETRKGRTSPNKGKHLSDETRRKISEAGKGRHPSEETRKKMSEAQRLRWAKKKGLA